MADDNSTNNTEVFVYTERAVVPHDVVRVRVHTSVTIILENAFYQRQKLEEVKICEGLLEIGEQAFMDCEALKKINIPSTVTKVHSGAFCNCYKLEEVELCEGLLEIGHQAFYYCTSLKRINIPSTITQIHRRSFMYCKQLEELELCEGLQTIEERSFFMCQALKRLTIPNTVRSIGDLAFCHVYQLQYLRLPEGIESIGMFAFGHNRCTTCRIPPSLTRLPSHFIGSSKSMFSLEISEGVMNISGHKTQCNFQSLRNIAFPLNAEVEDIDKVFERCTVLQQLYGTQEDITKALKRRFDDLPIHKMIYYQSYDNVTVEQLNNATNMRRGQRRSLRSKLDPSGSQGDCLGMTPLHILACSTVQNLELYRVLVNKYPETLIAKDRWEAIPLLYAIWGNAPDEIVEFLLDSYKSVHPNYELNWTNMMKTLDTANVPLDVIRNLLDKQERSFSDQSIEWDVVLKQAASGFLLGSEEEDSQKRLRCLVKYSMAERIRAIGLKQYRDDMSNMIEGEGEMHRRQNWLDGVKRGLSEYEKKYNELKEATTMIELILWENEINKSTSENKHSKKRAKIEEADLRKQCRVNCGANIINQHVLPFLTG